jgi:hypothetical protein
VLTGRVSICSGVMMLTGGIEAEVGKSALVGFPTSVEQPAGQGPGRFTNWFGAAGRGNMAASFTGKRIDQNAGSRHDRRQRYRAFEGVL